MESLYATLQTHSFRFPKNRFLQSLIFPRTRRQSPRKCIRLIFRSFYDSSQRLNAAPPHKSSVRSISFSPYILLYFVRTFTIIRTKDYFPVDDSKYVHLSCGSPTATTPPQHIIQAISRFRYPECP